jgi:hypothetical protein
MSASVVAGSTRPRRFWAGERNAIGEANGAMQALAMEMLAARLTDANLPGSRIRSYSCAHNNQL